MKQISSKWIPLLAIFGVATAALGGDAQKHPSWSFAELAHVPVQGGGRIKPLDSFAREVMLLVTGSRSYDGWNPTDLLVSWMVDPRAWEEIPFIQVSQGDAKKQLGLDVLASRFSPKKLLRESYLLQYTQELSQKAAPGKTDMRADPREKEIRAVMERLGLYRNIVSGDAWALVPSKTAGAPWNSLAGQDSDGNAIRIKFRDLALAYRDGNQSGFEKAAFEVRQEVELMLPQGGSSVRSVISAEVLYHRVHPFLWTWILYFAAGVFWLLKYKPTQRIAVICVGLGFGLHVFGISLRCYIAGRPPVTNMYESIVWVSLGVMLFGYILYRLQKQKLPLIVACFLATLGLIAADAAPAVMDPALHPLVPVLRSNYWLTIHVLTITISYAAFALAFGISNITLWTYVRPKPGMLAKVSNLNLLSYRVMQFGVVLVAAGTILGGVWADYSWGRFWGWDPKEVWALIVLMTYLVILHGRYAGWVGQFGFAVWSVVSFLTVIMAWYGVNFVLGVGLHSYGFSQGGRGTVFAFVAVQLLYVLAVVVRKRWMTTNGPLSP